ncbi:MAG: hypothetical protein JWO72_683 [Caulobacteraceae bacterium]|nr:hypothetical protein [Caulobacteraceae bacterium]
MPSQQSPSAQGALWWAGVAVAVVVAAAAGATHAAPRAKDAAAPAGITGMWLLNPSEYDRDEKMPFTAKGTQVNEARRKAVEDSLQVISNTNKKCLPVGMPVFMTNEFALEIIESPGRVTMISENSSLPRSIYLNETVHTKGVEPGWNGHSIGRWQGRGVNRTLVVDTVNFNDRVGPVFRSGIHSPTTHLVERFHLLDANTLEGVMTFEDPVYLAKPWTSTHTYKRLPAKAELWEYACEPDAAGWSERYAGDPDAKKPPQ